MAPSVFGTRDWLSGGQVFHGPEGNNVGERVVTDAGDGFRIIKAHYIYRVLKKKYYFYISSTSDHSALDPGDWGTPTFLYHAKSLELCPTL